MSGFLSVPYLVPVVTPVTATFIASAANPGGAAPPSTAQILNVSASYGNASDGDLVIVICLETADASSISAVTVDGAAATQAVVANATTGTVNNIAAIYYKAGVAATSGTIAVDMGVSETWGLGVSTYRVKAANITSVFDTGSATDATSAATVTMSNLTVPSNGVAVCGVVGSTQTNTFTWSGTGSPTEKDDYATTTDSGSGACQVSSSTTSTPGTNNITANGSHARIAMVGASWA